MAPSTNPQEQRLTSDNKGNNKQVDNFFSLSTRPAQPISQAAPTPLSYITNPPSSTVDRSRFFPSRRHLGTEETPVEQSVQNQREDNTTSEKIPSHNFTGDNHAYKSRRATRIDELEKKAPTETQRTLQRTRPAETWVTGLSSWRRDEATQQGPTQNPSATRTPAFPDYHKQQQSTLSPFAPAFQSYSGSAMAPRSAPAPAPAPSMRMGGAFPAVQGFRPMHQKLNPEARNQPLTSEELEFRRSRGISKNYQGEATNPQNISADIPDHENCGLWLTSLPPTCGYKDLLGALAQLQPGRVFSTYLTPPDPTSDQSLPSHRTSAAKIVFYRPQEAQRLLNACSLGLFKVQGYRVMARRNRIKSAAQPMEKEHTTRCLLLSGPRAIVDEVHLRRAWEGYFSFETEEVILLGERDGMRWLEWRFASHRAQAGSAFKFLKTEPGYQGLVMVKYGRDPCERVN